MKTPMFFPVRRYRFIAILSTIFVLFGCSSVLNSGDTGTPSSSSSSSAGASLELRYGTTTIASGGTLNAGSVLIGSYKDLTLALRNKGSKFLVLSGSPAVAIEGTDAAQFVLKTTSFPTILQAGAYQAFKIRFTPASLGTKQISIKIASSDAANASYNVTVTCTADPIAVTSLTLSSSTLAVGVGETSLLTAAVLPANATYSGVNWTSSNTAAATVSDTGLVTAVASGSATITATTEDSSFSAACTVTVYNPSSWAAIAPTTSLFLGRRYHQAVEFKDKLYVFGGNPIGITSNEVWSSPDGAAWTDVTPAAAFSGRTGHACAVFAGKIWLVGGADSGGTKLNDVWSSSDGLTWTEVLSQDGSVTTASTTRFSPRTYAGLVTDGTKLYVVGGFYDLSNLYNDVYSTTDGVTWTRVRQNGAANGFTGLYNNAAAYLNGAFYVFCGSYAGDNYSSDIWKSTDGGVTWTTVSTTAPYTPRLCMATVVYGGKIWLTGGYNNPFNGLTGFNDLWSSSDGQSWTQVIADGSAPFSKRFGSALTVFKNRLVLVGGCSDTGSTFNNDVWQVQ